MIFRPSLQTFWIGRMTGMRRVFRSQMPKSAQWPLSNLRVAQPRFMVIGAVGPTFG